MKKKNTIIYCFILSFLFLLLCTKNSPLYKMNDWYDVNAFFTMGKSMINGVVPYKELFEQKGPLLYFIYGIGSLISKTSFLGIFILEVVSLTITLIYIVKISNLFFKKDQSYIILPIILTIILSSKVFTHGGSCEEFCFPFIIITLYYFTKYLQSSKINNKETMLVGIMASCILMMKYTLLGFHLGFIIVVLIKSYQVKDFSGLLKKMLWFIIGFLLGSLPWLLYFFINDGLKDFIEVYFLFNMTSYSEKMSVFKKIARCIILMFKTLITRYEFLLLVVLPILLSIKDKILFKDKKDNIYLLIVLLCVTFGIYIGGTNYHYYSLPIYLFILFGIIVYLKIYYVFIKNKHLKNLRKTNKLIIIYCCLLVALIKSDNTYYMFKKRDDYAQFIFADIIEKNSTILNYGFLDGGFYFSTNTIPSVYYFEKQNVNYLNYPKNMDEQNRYIEEKKVDYVITRNNNRKDIKGLSENYSFLKKKKQEYEGKIVEYQLYKKN